jgi:predicted CXXCH cytochrome family protein
MKNSSKNFYVILMIAIIGYLIYPLPEATVLTAGIKNTHHDFSRSTWSNGEICKPCHIPHNANTDVQNSPLWNHELSLSTYQVYVSSSLNSSPEVAPLGKSKLCLSCHDGTIAIENHSGTKTGSRHVNFGNVGTDLRNDHPISFEYNTALANDDGELYDPSSAMSGLGGTIADDLLDNGRMECSSCHDVHVARKTSEGCSGCHFVHGGMITKSLSIRIDNAGSALCLTCHNK